MKNDNEKLPQLIDNEHVSGKNFVSNILKIFFQQPQREFNYKQIASQMGINDEKGRAEVQKVIAEMYAAGTLKSSSRGRYKLKSKTGLVEGIVAVQRSGNAYIVSDDLSEDVFVSLSNLNTALNGDTVRVSLYARGRNRRLEGEVVQIVKRFTTRFVGRLEKSGGYYFLIPDSNKMAYDIFVPKDNLAGAHDNQKVVVEIVEWHGKSKNPTGKVVDILGTPGENNVEMHAIMSAYGLPYKFDNAVETAAEKLSGHISQHDYDTRADFRDVPTFTIDPADAKDFDDALSFRRLENSHFEVGVHIADVTHFVQPDTVIDDEAYRRATSVYLVDRVVPMLPERLSNNLCSLRPDEEKLCFSVVLELDENAHLIDYQIVKSIIKSNRRFSYNEVQQILDTQTGDFVHELTALNSLAKVLRDRRFGNGAFDFDHPEVRFKLDEAGAPVEIYFEELQEANHLIEEFMLLANKTVAEHVGKARRSKEFVYRVHARPDEDKLLDFCNFVGRFGYTIDTSNAAALSGSLNDIVRRAKGRPEQEVIESMAVRAMAKAVYTTKNIGHYGLAFDYYTHFTSPIRRYPDILVHRLLHAYLDGQNPAITSLEGKAKHCSQMEQQAVLVERASIKYKQTEFMMDKIGRQFDGVISGVTEWGFFVQLKENTCEGLVHIRTLNDDVYTYFPDKYAIVGNYGGRCYQLGDQVAVVVAEVNLQKKYIDFELADR